MDTAPKRVLQKVVLALDAARVDYAVGGGAALEAHGYRRTVDDLEVFVSPDHSAVALGVVGAAGFMVEPVPEPGQYTAVETKGGRKLDPSHCLALLFPAEDPEHAATLAPESRTVSGMTVKVFPLVLLVAAKWYSNRPEDDLDFEALLNRGLMPTRAVVDYLRATGDLAGAQEFKERMRALATPRRPRPRPQRSRS